MDYPELRPVPTNDRGKVDKTLRQVMWEGGGDLSALDAYRDAGEEKVALEIQAIWTRIDQPRRITLSNRKVEMRTIFR